MKQLFSVLAIALVVLTGCGKDDKSSNDESINKKDLIGTWFPEKQVLIEKGKDPITEEVTYNKGCPSIEVFTFTNSEMIEIIYDLNNDGVCEKEAENKYTYKVKGNKIIVDNSFEIEIVKLSKNELVFKTEEKGKARVTYFKKK